MSAIVVAAYLIDCAKIVVIPAKFIYKLSFAKSINNRVNRNQIHLIFWSENEQDQPNFHLQVSKKFSQNRKMCFHANLLQAFGKD